MKIVSMRMITAITNTSDYGGGSGLSGWAKAAVKERVATA